MPQPLPLDVFESLLADLDVEELGAFVAAIWRARDADVRWDPQARIVTVSHERDRETSRLLVSTPSRRIRSIGSRGDDRYRTDVDAVVVPFEADTSGSEASSAADVIDSAELRRIVLYALDRETADEVCRTHLGRPAWMAVGESTACGPRRLGPLTGTQVVGIALVLLMVTLPLIGVSGVADRFVGPSSDSGSGGDTVPAPATTAEGPQSEPESGGVTGTATASEDSGLTDLDILTRAHERRLTVPYLWTISYRAYRNGSTVGRITETIRMRQWNIYRSDIDRTSDLTPGGWAFNDGEIYADGNRWYARERLGDRVIYRSGLVGEQYGTSPFVLRAQQYIEIFLRNASIAEVRDTNHATLYKLTAEGDPPQDTIANVTTTAWFSTSRGVISLEAHYTNPLNDAERSVFRFRYRFIDVSVTPPTWYDDARNATVS